MTIYHTKTPYYKSSAEINALPRAGTSNAPLFDTTQLLSLRHKGSTLQAYYLSPDLYDYIRAEPGVTNMVDLVNVTSLGGYIGTLYGSPAVVSVGQHMLPAKTLVLVYGDEKYVHVFENYAAQTPSEPEVLDTVVDDGKTEAPVDTYDQSTLVISVTGGRNSLETLAHAVTSAVTESGLKQGVYIDSIVSNIDGEVFVQKLESSDTLITYKNPVNLEVSEEPPIIAGAFALLQADIQKSTSYAWSWHCNLAMAVVDAGGSHELGNKASASFLQRTFSVDVTRMREYRGLEVRWADQKEASTPQPTPTRLALCLKLSDAPSEFRSVDVAPTMEVVALKPGFWSTPTFLVDRAYCESAETLRQVLPYIVLRSKVDGKIFTYSRGKGGAESRLVGNLSIGLGGHVDAAVPTGTNLEQWCVEEARRELNEEAGIDFPVEIAFIGLLRDDTNPVGRVHMGILAIVYVDPSEIKRLEDGIIENGEWRTVEDLRGEKRLENWSVLALQGRV